MWPTTATTQLARRRPPDAPITPGPAQEGITTHELLKLLGMSFRTDATIARVEPGRRLQ
jgi:hypothetical protein